MRIRTRRVGGAIASVSSCVIERAGQPSPRKRATDAEKFSLFSRVTICGERGVHGMHVKYDFARS